MTPKHERAHKTPEAETAAMPQDTMPQAETEDIAALKESLKQAEEQRDEYLKMAQRVQADFENFRRRNQNTRGEAYDDGLRAQMTDMLPVIDNLERALDTPTADDTLHTGVTMVYRLLMEALEKRGLVVICRKGEIFDPNLEDAVVTAPPSEGDIGTVCEVFQKGYQMGDKVLRHAMVKVVAE